MKLLLDTHVLLWASIEPEKLPANTQQLLNNPLNNLIFSSVSLWEVAIKSSLNRDDFQLDARLLRRGLLDNGYHELPITSLHAVTISQLPKIHRDPFDRVLVAQSISEGITLLTADPILSQYPGPIKFIH